jgi:hypothetical protein
MDIILASFLARKMSRCWICSLQTNTRPRMVFLTAARLVGAYEGMISKSTMSRAGSVRVLCRRSVCPSSESCVGKYEQLQLLQPSMGAICSTDTKPAFSYGDMLKDEEVYMKPPDW